MHTSFQRRAVSVSVFLVALVALLLPGCGSAKPRVVLYCAQDQEFAEQVFEDFTKREGVDVAPRYDTEANKSVSLYEELIREQRHPRCDVFWNNEVRLIKFIKPRGPVASVP